MASASPSFLVAGNPDPDSSLPYLLRLPIDGGIALKARERWPATSRVYCHPAEEWPAGAEVIEDVPVRRCVRRGRAVDLILDRGNRNRSQFVFTEPRPGRRNGRPMIFWQTARTARRARPGQRVPRSRAAGALTIHVDTRERYPYRFAKRGAERERRKLPVGDYALFDGERPLAVVERKTFEDFQKALIDGSLGFRMAELAALPLAAVVVEERYSALTRVEQGKPSWLLELVGQLQARYPSVPIAFADSRKMAEEWTFRFLSAASGLSQEG